MNDRPPGSASSGPNRSAFRIAGHYLVIGSLWILFSDQLAAAVTSTPAASNTVNTLKGWAFIIATAVLLYGFIRRDTAALRASEAQYRLLGREDDMNTLYWASVVSALGWIYAALAAAWPWLFQREAVRQAERVPEGYRVGWLVHWRLPARAAVLIAVLSGLPILSAVWLQGWLRPSVVVLTTVAVLAAWIGAPPGTRLTYAPAGQPSDRPRFELRSTAGLWRAVGVLVVVGLAPALVLSWVIAGFWE